jgi:hypothetical protein
VHEIRFSPQINEVSVGETLTMDDETNKRCIKLVNKPHSDHVGKILKSKKR